jgi:hypothetical protein
VIAGLLLALGAALTTGIASVLQGLAARRAAASTSDSPTESVGRLVFSPLYLSGVALDALGFGCTIVSLHWLHLFLVQCAAASSVGVTALIGRRVLGTVLGRPSVVALSTLGFGLVLLASGAKAEEATALARSAQWWLVIATGPVVVAGGVALHRAVRGSGSSHAGGILAAIAGVSFAGTGVASRVLSDAHSVKAVLIAPATYALAIFGVAGMAFFAAALQRTPVTIATAALFGVETLAASAVGLLALGDSTRDGFVVPSALGFVVTLASALFLALNDDEDPATVSQITPGAAVPDH